MFSKACEYAIRASIYIGQQSLLERKISLKEVSKEIDSPIAYTSKILQQLTKNNIINSDKGPTGGFSMDKSELAKIKLSTIVLAIDGDLIYKGCGLGLEKCNELKPCPVHFEFKAIRDELKKMLQNTSIKELAGGIENGLTFLKR
jgi:Rrf2 family iron-sulfur cluster assembly transcriptional regulator